ncbi:response regulator [Nocardiopsis dassonvillei]|uniref:response regulator n=1 Tax=Nocardiopsis dassonvillei TaxID=2014 RepID=UPI00367288E5
MSGMGETVVSVLVVDDQVMIRAGLSAIVDGAPGLRVVGEAGDGRTGRELASRLRPDVVLMDLRMPVENGVEATRALRADPALAGVRVLVLTTFDGDADVLEAVRAGADGFLGKGAGPDELVETITAVAAGEITLSQTAVRALVSHVSGDSSREGVGEDPVLAERVGRLTERERDMVTAAALGLSNEEIARQRVLSPYTVKAHLNRAMTKLDARDRGQLVSIAYRSGLVR